MKSHAGFTLVEVLVAGILSTILATTILSTLYLTNTQMKEGLASQRLTQFQIVVSEQIRKNARIAFAVKIVGDHPTNALSADTLSELIIHNESTVFFCNPAGAIFAGYRIHTSPDYLEEWSLGLNSFIPFRIGLDSVALKASASTFVVLPKRRGVLFKLSYESNQAGISQPRADPPLRGGGIEQCSGGQRRGTLPRVAPGSAVTLG